MPGGIAEKALVKHACGVGGLLQLPPPKDGNFSQTLNPCGSLESCFP